MKKVLQLACFLIPAITLAQNTTTTVTQQTTTPGSGTINMSIGGMPMGTTSQQTTTTITTTTTGGDMSQPQSVPPPPPAAVPTASGCQAPMQWDDYEGAKRSLDEKTFEDTKLTLAKQIASANCMSAEQIRGIMKQFTFENSKLEFAKFAYAHCCDKANYFKVNDAFQFDSSSQDLDKYISNQPQ